MRSWTFALLPICVSATSDGACLDSDETLLLQTKAVTKTQLQVARRAPLRVHHFKFDAEESVVSLLQSAEQTTAVYALEFAGEKDLTEEEIDSHGAAIDHCGELHVYNEEGEGLFPLTGCFPAAVSPGSSFLFAEQPGFEVAEDSLVELGLIEASDADEPEVVLIAIPEMDEATHLLAKEEVEKKLQDFSEASVLFTGAGANWWRSNQRATYVAPARPSYLGRSSWCTQDERTMPSFRRRRGCDR